MAHKGADEVDYGSSGSSDSVNLKLHRATKPQAILKLLSSKASLNHSYQDREGNSALHVCVGRAAAAAHKQDCLMALLTHTQCNVNLVNLRGCSALHVAVNQGELFSMKALIAFGAELNLLDQSNRTPFDIVCSQRRTDLGEVLSRVGAKRAGEVLRQREEEEREREEEEEEEERMRRKAAAEEHTDMVDPQLLRESLSTLASEEGRGGRGGGGRVDRPTHLVPIRDDSDDEGHTTTKKTKKQRSQAAAARHDQVLRFATPEASIEYGLTLNRASLAIKSVRVFSHDDSPCHSRQVQLSDLSDSFSPLRESPEASLHLSSGGDPDRDSVGTPDHQILSAETPDQLSTEAPDHRLTEEPDPLLTKTPDTVQPSTLPDHTHNPPDHTHNQVHINMQAPSQHITTHDQRSSSQTNGEACAPQENKDSLAKNWTMVDINKQGLVTLKPRDSDDCINNNNTQEATTEIISRDATPEHRQKKQSRVEYTDASDSPPKDGEEEESPVPYMSRLPKPPDTSIHRLFDFPSVDRIFQSVFKKLETKTDELLKDETTLHTSDEAFAARLQKEEIDYAKREIAADQLVILRTACSNGTTKTALETHSGEVEPTHKRGEVNETTEEAKIDLSNNASSDNDEIGTASDENAEEVLQSNIRETVQSGNINLSELKCPLRDETNSIESRVIENPFNHGFVPEPLGTEAAHQLINGDRKTLPKADPIRRASDSPESRVYGHATVQSSSPSSQRRRRTEENGTEISCADDKPQSRGGLRRQRYVETSPSPQPTPAPQPNHTPDSKSPANSPQSKSPLDSPMMLPKPPVRSTRHHDPTSVTAAKPPHPPPAGGGAGAKQKRKKKYSPKSSPPPTAESPRPSTRQSSLRRELSIVNPGMTVTTSILGHSVAPLRRKLIPMKSIRKQITGGSGTEQKVAGIGIRMERNPTKVGVLSNNDSGDKHGATPVKRQLYQDSYYLASEPEYKEERILCLDGGGVKGLIQIEILQQIEKFTGKKIVDLFDWIVGTSTGGIIALAMVYAGMDLHRLRQLYFEMKETVFRRKSKVMNQVCDTKALEALLHRTFEEKMMMSETKPKVLITAVHKKTSTLPVRLFNNCLNDEYTNFPVWKVARYTSAAPVYFKECDDYVDGGVKANNPCSYGLTRIQRYNRQKKEGTKISCLVSVGCGIFPPEPIGNTDIAAAIKVTQLHKAPGRMMELLKLLTNALPGSEEAAWFCQNQCEEQGIPFYRFNPDIGEEVDTAELDNNKLFNLIIETKYLLHSSADHVRALVEHLKQ